jgi:transmembrane sensor
MTNARQIEAAAADWLLRREEPAWSAEDEAALQSWLDESYANRAAYWRLECGWRKADRIGSLGPHIAVPSDAWRRRPVGWRPLAAAACAIAILVATPIALHLPMPGSEPTAAVQYRAPIGGHQQVKLSDGSTVELNTATTIRTALTKAQRDVWLDTGDAFFSVVHTGIPFVVHAGPRVITVVGTKFSVSRDGDKVRVAVVEGKVRVSTANSTRATPEATITRGNLLDAEGDSTLVLQNASKEVERSLAWRSGLLLFDHTPLIEAAKEFNRYNRRKLVIEAPAVAAIPIGGSFNASNVDAFARLLHDAYGLQVEYSETEMRVSA